MNIASIYGTYWKHFVFEVRKPLVGGGGGGVGPPAPAQRQPSRIKAAERLIEPSLHSCTLLTFPEAKR